MANFDTESWVLESDPSMDIEFSDPNVVERVVVDAGFAVRTMPGRNSDINISLRSIGERDYGFAKPQYLSVFEARSHH